MLPVTEDADVVVTLGADGVDRGKALPALAGRALVCVGDGVLGVVTSHVQ